MTPHPPETSWSSSPVAHGSPIDTAGPRYPMYTEDFATDPHQAYQEMRSRWGSMVPVEIAPGIPATLVVSYRTALRILNDPDHFRADPRAWQKKVPSGCPILPMLEWRPNALRSDGPEHERYRAANSAAIGGVDLNAMHAAVEEIAIPLINAFCQAGSADLIGQYAFPLVFQALNTILGCSADVGEQVATGMAAMFDSNESAQEGGAMLAAALLEHTGRKRSIPGDDITSRLIAHPEVLSDSEMVHQLVTLYGAGIEPQVHLIGNALRLMLTDDRFASDVLGGNLSTRDALDEVLFTDPPLANYCVTYPRQPILIDHVWLPADQPVLISMAACNTDPSVRSMNITGNRSHLAFSAGPHTCPAQQIAYLIAQDAIDQLLDGLPEIRLAGSPSDLTWRPGPFHRALAELPVTFPPSPPLRVNFS